MEIGKPKRSYIVEPAQRPVPEERPASPAPAREPVAPKKAKPV